MSLLSCLRKGLGGTRIITPSIRRASAVQLYSSVIEKIAHNKKIEDDKKVKSEESIAKKVKRLRDTAPHELLDAKIRISISEALASKKGKGKGKSGKLATYIYIYRLWSRVLRESVR